MNTHPRQSGNSSDILSAVTKYADAYGLPLQAHVRADLHAFYAQYGFVLARMDEKFQIPLLHRRPR